MNDFLLYLLATVISLYLLIWLCPEMFPPLSDNRHYRRWRGSHWELRMYDTGSGTSTAWEQYPTCQARVRFANQHGQVTCEDYPLKERS